MTTRIETMTLVTLALLAAIIMGALLTFAHARDSIGMARDTLNASPTDQTHSR